MKKLGPDHPETLATLNSLALRTRTPGSCRKQLSYMSKFEVPSKLKKLGADILIPSGR